MPSNQPLRSIQIKRVRHIASGRVIERYSVDAHELVRSGHYAPADDAVSVRDQLHEMTVPALLALAAAHGIVTGVPGEAAGPALHDGLVDLLVPHAESGALPLPAAEA